MSEELAFEKVFLEQSPSILALKHELWFRHQDAEEEAFEAREDIPGVAVEVLDQQAEFHIKDFLDKFASTLLDLNQNYQEDLNSQHQLYLNEEILLSHEPIQD